MQDIHLKVNEVAMSKGYSCASRGGSSWGAGRDRRRVCAENFWKYIDNSFKIAAGERWRSGKAGTTGSFYNKVQGNNVREQHIYDFESFHLNLNATGVYTVVCENY